jgi:hypothetical protein
MPFGTTPFCCARLGDVSIMMQQLDANADEKVSFEEFVDSASYLKTPLGVSTDGFNSLLKLVARGYVGKGDDEVCAIAVCVFLSLSFRQGYRLSCLLSSFV